MLKFYFYTKKSNQLKNGLFSFEFHFTKLELKKSRYTYYKHIGFSGDFESKGTYSETTSNEISAETSL